MPIIISVTIRYQTAPKEFRVWIELEEPEPGSSLAIIYPRLAVPYDSGIRQRDAAAFDRLLPGAS